MTFPLPLRPLALVAGLSCLLLSASCTYDKGEQDTPKPCTDVLPATVSYALDIKPILKANCQKCHGENVYLSLGGGNNYDLHSVLQKYARSGTLMGVLEQKDARYAAVYMPRPIGAAKLPACDIERIRAWVNAGAPDN